MFTRIIYAASVALLFSACATPPAPLSELKPQYPSIDVALVDSEDDVFISMGGAEYQMPTYYYMPPGTSFAAGAAAGAIAFLIIAGINGAEAADARSDAEPMQEVLAGFDHGALLRAELESVPPMLNWTDVGDVFVLENPEPKTLAQAIENSDASGLLVIGANFYLSRNADTAVVAAQALLHPVPVREEGAKPLRNAPPAVFSTSVSYEMPAPVEGSRRADFIPAWIENDGAALRAAVTRGAPIVAQLLSRQLEEGNAAIVTPDGQKPERRTFKALGQPLKVKAQLLESGPDGELLRIEGGSLRFLAPPYDPASATPLTIEELNALPYQGAEPALKLEPELEQETEAEAPTM